MYIQGIPSKRKLFFSRKNCFFCMKNRVFPGIVSFYPKKERAKRSSFFYENDRTKFSEIPANRKLLIFLFPVGNLYTVLVFSV